MQDTLGNRVKNQYEDRTRYMLPRRTYTIIRLDGKAFKTYTRNLKKPFDTDLSTDIDAAIIAMLSEIQGAVFAYTQSDEISVLLTDFATPNTSAWFDGNLQKMCSVSASIITAEFNKYRWNRYIQEQSLNLLSIENKTAYFDSRIFTVPDRIEVMNCFRWRQQDCIRNSVSMVAQANFSHGQLQGKSSPEMHEMLHQKGVNWATDFTDGEKNGRVIVKEEYMIPFVLPKTDIQINRDESTGIASTPNTSYAPRHRWVAKGAWIFTQDEGKLLNMIPSYV